MLYLLLFLLCCLLTSTFCPYCGPLLWLRGDVLSPRYDTKHFRALLFHQLRKKQNSNNTCKKSKNSPQPNNTMEEEWKRSRSTTRHTAWGRLPSLWHMFSIARFWPAACREKAKPGSLTFSSFWWNQQQEEKPKCLASFVFFHYLKGWGEWWEF